MARRLRRFSSASAKWSFHRFTCVSFPARGQAPLSQVRGKFKTLFVLNLPLSIRSTR